MFIKGIYQRFRLLWRALGLNHDDMRYYANKVLKSEIFQVARRHDEDRYLHLLAFVAHQYHRLQDNLMDVLLTCIQNYQNRVQQEYQEKIQNEAPGDIEKLAWAPLPEKPEKPENNELLSVAGGAAIRPGDEDYCLILEKYSVRLQNQVDPIFRVLEFQGEAIAEPLLVALADFRAKDGRFDGTTPTEFLTQEQRDAVAVDGHYRQGLYKAFLFLHVQNGIKSGVLSLRHSYKFQSLDDFPIEPPLWQRDRNVLLARAGSQDLCQCCLN